MRVKDAVGRFGEQVAAEHLISRGLVVLERNWRCRTGEIDIVAVEGATLVFVEVKTRSSLAFGSPAEAVDRRKASRVRALATVWLRDRREAGDSQAWARIRFDAVCVLRPRYGPVQVAHVVGAF